jgi:hypothetical protein
MDDWTDLLKNFMEYTDGIPSPDLFRLWSGITMISGALERRVWLETSRSVLYPNLYILLVAPPAVGKSISIKEVSQFWYDTKKFHIAPSNATKASLVDCISRADGKRLVNANLVEYHSLLAASSEFGVMVPAHDLEFLSVLTDIYDCPPRYSEERRSLGNKQVDIVNPQLTFIAGTQPAYMASMMPEEAWGQGFTSRLIMIYSATAPKTQLFGNVLSDPRWPLKRKIIKQLEHLTTLFGCATFDEEAKARLQLWLDSGCAPEPTHSKLINYNGRRILHLLKLSLIAAVANTGLAHVRECDVERAMQWLFQAEECMPDIFRDMQQKSDSQVIQELHFFMWKLWTKDKRPLHESRLIHFLSTRIPSEKIMRVLDIAERSHVISREAGTALYVPKPLTEHGVE